MRQALPVNTSKLPPLLELFNNEAVIKPFTRKMEGNGKCRRK
jgi:hypothetical protein